ncbi:MAG: type I restriction endonuclease subunit R [Planctomycetaceae bacterium]|nr:MAG: type I restriction endonuclease subunit R [Planctomycetaceae bacterium]
MEKLHGPETGTIVLDDLCKALDGAAGSLGVLRHGFKCFGKRIYAAFFAPAHGMNPENARLYAANRLTVTRQLHYSQREPGKSLDLALSLNGIPVATAELKNPLTGQTVVHARRQYMTDRDPRDKIFQFKQRALVHFAVDPDQVSMTTRLNGKSTRFLPFNQGDHHGAGNPPSARGYRTSYLWEEVWQRDSWLDILARFIHLEVVEKQVEGKKIRTETMIFPRYHQLDSVRKLEAHARAAGAGTNYLIQHSAGSGKSNEIGWLVHRLASLHDDQDQKVFDSVIVVTDRTVLDQQLQDTIYQFEHKQGVVAKIDATTKSTQLAEELTRGTPIIVVTLQTFPFVVEKISQLPERRYAVIVDEAHSSQSGETASELKGVLAAGQIREKARREAEEQGLAAEHEEMLLREMAKRGRQPNLSFFAFTATPKYKTLEVFGVPGPDGKPVPFHLYSMRQAIEEGFILDVLKHYTTYKTYFQLIKSAEDDPRVEKRKAARALARFTSLHPHNIAQKVEVMLEHFRTHTRHKIGGKAKAMVVTSSRVHAVRYKQEFDRQIKEKGYNDIHTLVAFSGTVEDPDVKDLSYTEPGMNIDIVTQKPIGEKQLPERFGEADYQVLIVADKYQTGFDQPLLHTMYVDKRLAGVQAVQTLSRLNRTCAGKDDTFVLDFYNEANEIEEAFKPYYERTTVGRQAEPAQLNDLFDKIMDRQIIWREEVERLCEAFYRNKPSRGKDDHSRLYVYTDPAVGRFKAIQDEEVREEFRGQVMAFRNLYAFLSQIIPFADSDLEKLYTYLRFFIRRLPRPERGPTYDFDDEVALKFYKLQKQSEGAIALDGGIEYPLDGPTEVGTGQQRGPEIELSKLIDLLNERFGTQFTPADQLFFDQIREHAAESPELRQAALANPIDAFKFVFDKALQGLFIDRMEQNDAITTKFLNDESFSQAVTTKLREEVYEQIRAEAEVDSSA